MMITSAEADAIGARLARVLFPRPVFTLLADVLRYVVTVPHAGIRIRLDMDPALVDLPWEYVQRPDRIAMEGLSSHLLLDPTISMVRQRVDPEIAIEPIAGKQRLEFVGALWEGERDGWEVRSEFERLRDALDPVAHYLEPKFDVASDRSAFAFADQGGAAIFHYGGHCDFATDGRAYLVRELPSSESPADSYKMYLDALAPVLARAGSRLVVMSACNSGYWQAVRPLLEARIPAIIGVNGAVATDSTIEFCAKLYESLCLGLTLDEAIGRARLHVMEWGRDRGVADWGLYMLYMPSPESTLLPRTPTDALAQRQADVREQHAATIETALQHAKTLDGMNFGEIMSVLSRRRVLILGRFTEQRLEVLEAIKSQLQAHPNGYIPELFTFAKPETRDLVESIVGFAALSRFVVADLSDPKSIPAELEAIVPNFQSVPVVPLLNQTGEEYATFASVKRRPNVVKPTLRYSDAEDIRRKVDDDVVPSAERMREQIRAAATE